MAAPARARIADALMQQEKADFVATFWQSAWPDEFPPLDIAPII